MTVDYLIVGQGISGTLLSYYLDKAGVSFLVIDEQKTNTASRVAAGLINPVTGRRLVKSWMTDELMPFAWDAYTKIGNELHIDCIREMGLLQFFNAPDMQEAFNRKLVEEPAFLQPPGDQNWKQYFNYPFGYGEISPCYVVNMQGLLHTWRRNLGQRIIEQKFEKDLLQIHNDDITYQHIVAKKIIFCDGEASMNSAWFSKLPFSLNKGEALWLHIPGLPTENIYKFKQMLIPVEPHNNIFWFGSNYEWSYDDDLPSAAFRKAAEEELQRFLRLPFTIIDHKAAIRPANIERRPFVGLHPSAPQVGIFNGMGTKGCSLAPYFANQFVDHLLYDKPLPGEVDVKRFRGILTN